MVAMRECCFSGHLDEALPLGRVERLGGVKCYSCKPASKGNTAVIIATDLFGLNTQNVKLIADQFAKKGNFQTVVPDLFNGGAAPHWLMSLFIFLTFNRGMAPPRWPFDSFLRPLVRLASAFIVLPMMVYFLVRHSPQKKFPIIQAVMDDLKAERGIQKVCIVGYCYGMPIAIHFARQAGAVSAFAVAHGAIKLPDDVKQLQAPGFFACAEKDPMLPASARGHLQALITKRKDLTLRMKVYEGSFHGFAIRGDARDPKIQAARQDVLERMIEFFQQHS